MKTSQPGKIARPSFSGCMGLQQELTVSLRCFSVAWCQIVPRTIINIILYLCALLAVDISKARSYEIKGYLRL